MISFCFTAVSKHTSCQNKTSKEISDSIKKILIGVGDWDNGRTAQFVPAPAAGVSRADEQITDTVFSFERVNKTKKYLLKQLKSISIFSLLSTQF